MIEPATKKKASSKEKKQNRVKRRRRKEKKLSHEEEESMRQDKVNTRRWSWACVLLVIKGLLGLRNE